MKDNIVPLHAKRPEPPASMNEEQAAIWHQTASAMPPDWFKPDTFPLLEGFCGHVHNAQILDRQLNDFDVAWLKDEKGMWRYKKLLDMREKQTRVIQSLATVMRLTHQSRYKAEKAEVASRKTNTGKKPWEE